MHFPARFHAAILFFQFIYLFFLGHHLVQGEGLEEREREENDENLWYKVKTSFRNISEKINKSTLCVCVCVC